jgi:ribosomal protein S12 methylthiotransferase accessory factor YcaO
MEDEQPTCGKGLAAHAPVPENIGAFVKAMAELLQNHTRSLALDDADANLEREAYNRLVREQRAIASSLEALAAAMRSYRDLPMAAHDVSALSDQRSLDIFASFIRAEERLISVLQENATQHRAMLSAMGGS